MSVPYTIWYLPYTIWYLTYKRTYSGELGRLLNVAPALGLLAAFTTAILAFATGEPQPYCSISSSQRLQPYCVVVAKGSSPSSRRLQPY